MTTEETAKSYQFAIRRELAKSSLSDLKSHLQNINLDIRDSELHDWPRTRPLVQLIVILTNVCPIECFF